MLQKPQLYGSVRVTVADAAIVVSNYNLVEHNEFYKRFDIGTQS